MLELLHIENIAIIEEAEIAFRPGFNALTGETGAGKSIVIDAMSAVLGQRTSRDLIRTGASKAFVSALFSHVDPALCEELGASPDENGDLMLQREIGTDGKNVCRVGGRPVTVSQLRTLGSRLVNIHGQHDGQQLLDEEQHLAYLDSFGKVESLLEAYADKYNSLTGIRRKMNALQMDEAEKARRMDTLQYQINELERAKLKPGEEEELQGRRNLLRNAEKFISAVSGADYALNGGEDGSGVLNLLRQAQDALGTVRHLDEGFNALYERLESAYSEAYDIAFSVAEQRENFDFSPNELDEVEGRLDQLYRLSLKYGATEQEMLGKLDEMRAQREEILFADRELETLSKSYDDLLLQVQAAAENLTGERKQVAAKLEKEVCRELAYLDMPGIRFVVDFGKGKLSSIGQDTVQFLISTNPGEPPKPLAKIASGGELSRIMLAIKTILAHKDTVGTLIFDEIDTGVSGRASQKIGLKLRAVAEDTQVICVTHSAQIASLAGAHFLIQKQVKGERTYTHVQRLDFDGRARELARIMGGLKITPALLSTAEEMLRTAREG